jgi:hypothetical protein
MAASRPNKSTTSSQKNISERQKKIFHVRKGFIVSNRKFQKSECQKKAVFIAFTALLPHSNILPPQKIDPLFIRILLSHKGRDEQESLLIRYLISLASIESAEKTEEGKAEETKNLAQIYKNLAEIAKECVDNGDDSKASILCDTLLICQKMTKQALPQESTKYFKKAAEFFLKKEDHILNYIRARKLVHPSIVRRSLEYARLSLDIAQHYAQKSETPSFVSQIEKQRKNIRILAQNLKKQEH